MTNPALTLLGRLAAVAVLALVAVPASASTLTQSFTLTGSFDVNSIAFGAPTALVSNSFFDVTFMPFVGNGLTSAVFTYADSATGTITAGPNGGGTFIYLFSNAVLNDTGVNVAGVTTDGSGGPNSVNSFSIGFADTSRDLLDSYSQSVGFPAVVTGSSPLRFTQYNPGGPVFSAQGAIGVADVSFTLTTTASLVYTFQGDGALLSLDVPEPASMALLATGLIGAGIARRRRA